MSDAIDLASLSKPAFLAHWFQRVWTEEDPAAIEQMMAGDAAIKGMGNVASVGPADFKVFQQSLLAKITDIRFTILHAVEDGNWMAALWSLTARDRETGKPVSTTGTVFVEIRDGKFTGGYNHFDAFGMYQDMGLLPQDTIPRLLSGSALQ